MLLLVYFLVVCKLLKSENTVSSNNVLLQLLCREYQCFLYTLIKLLGIPVRLAIMMTVT